MEIVEIETIFFFLKIFVHHCTMSRSFRFILRQLLQEPSWIAYKAPIATFYPGFYRLIAVPQAQRYLAAAGKPGGPFGNLGNLHPFLLISCVDFEFVIFSVKYKYILIKIIYIHAI